MTTLKNMYETGEFNCIVKSKGHIVIDKFNGFNGEALLSEDDFEFGYCYSMKSEYIKIHKGSYIIYSKEWEGSKFYLKSVEEELPKYLIPNYQFSLGETFYHIDEPNYKCEVVKLMDNYAYLLISNPSICKAFTIKTTDIGTLFFDTREQCIDARITRAKRELEFEIECKERKI